MRKTNILLLLIALLWNGDASATKIADITRIDGQRTNIIVGLGLVVGLKGTGDGGEFQPAIKPLAEMLGYFNDPATVEELNKVGNVALVSLTATIPVNGVRDGDKLDVYVSSIGKAQSLRGGRLFVTPLKGPDPKSKEIFALASGPLTIEDPSNPVVGRIPGGCVMEQTLRAELVNNGRFILIIEDPSASWATASTIAKVINEYAEGESGAQAIAVDPKNIVVTLPSIEKDRPDSFIARIQSLPLPDISMEARVTINEKTGSLIFTGDVDIAPVVIIHKGLTITVVPNGPGRGAPAIPVTKEAIPLDTANAGGAKLQDLVNTLDQLKVPAEDRIEIVKQLHKTGKLHAKLIME
jgi:flagellar P-ring protein precursor FlgI